MAKKHIVRRGEGISRIAEHHGFAPDTIWNHPSNRELRELRRDGNVLREGDEVAVPDLAPKTVEREVDARHRFRRRGVPAQFRLRLERNGEPEADVPYELWVDGALVRSARTDAEGWVRSYVPTRAREGELRLGPPVLETLALRFGELDPIDDLRGVEQRLANMRLLDRPPLGAWDDALRDALRRLQKLAGLREHGELDDATRDALVEAHDDAK